MESTNDEKFRKAIAPKSDQLNGDDLISGPITIKVVKVHVRDADQQPIDVHYDNDNGKPYKPCKSMGRVLAQCWGGPSKWIGKTMTLYRDEKVTWAGMEVGGIRISHLSDIAKPITMSLSASNKSKKPYTVQPLVVAPDSKPSLDDYIHDIATVPTTEGLEKKFKEAYKAYPDAESRDKLTLAKDKRKEDLSAP